MHETTAALETAGVVSKSGVGCPRVAFALPVNLRAALRALTLANMQRLPAPALGKSVVSRKLEYFRPLLRRLYRVA